MCKYIVNKGQTGIWLRWDKSLMWWSSQFLTDSSNQWENCEKDEDDFGKLNKKNEKI